MIDGLAVEVTYKQIKNLYISVKEPDGKVILSAPVGVAEKVLYEMVQQKRCWIVKQQEKIRRRPENLTNHHELLLWGQKLTILLQERIDIQLRGDCLFLPETDGDLKLSDFLQNTLIQEIPQRMEFWAKKIGVPVPLWKTRNMKSRWGSCNIRKRLITVNLRLVHRPIECLDYLLVHELCHLLEPRHNSRFWGLVARQKPNWKLLRAQLNGGA